MPSNSNMRRLECLQAPPRGFQFWKSAALLFDEVVFGSTHALRGLEDSLPIRLALAKQNLVALVWLRPVFTMDGPNAPRVGSNPRHRIRSRLHARSHVQLQHDGRLCVLSQNLHGTLAADGPPLGVVVVISDPESGGLELLGSGIQFASERLPRVEIGLRVTPCLHDVLAAQNQIQVARALNLARTEEIFVIVRR